MLIRPKNWANKHATRKLDLLPGGMLTLSPGQRKHVLCNTHTFSASPFAGMTRIWIPAKRLRE